MRHNEDNRRHRRREGFGPGAQGGCRHEGCEGHDHPRGEGESMRRRRGRGFGRGRAARGDVRTAVLLLLETEPMHGYQLMQAITDRTANRWSPSPGAIYPTINQLEDEGLVSVTAESGRRLVTLTDAGREHIATHRDEWSDPFEVPGQSGPDLRSLMDEVHGAVRLLGRAAVPQQERAEAVLKDAKKALFLILAEDE